MCDGIGFEGGRSVSSRHNGTMAHATCALPMGVSHSACLQLVSCMLEQLQLRAVYSR
jgi:hypothetical protein